MNRAEFNETIANARFATVTFTKKDGSTRVLQAALTGDEIEKIGGKEAVTFKTDRVFNEDIVKLYDVENKGWRSVRLESIHYVEVKGVRYE